MIILSPNHPAFLLFSQDPQAMSSYVPFDGKGLPDVFLSTHLPDTYLYTFSSSYPLPLEMSSYAPVQSVAGSAPGVSLPGSTSTSTRAADLVGGQAAT